MLSQGLNDPVGDQKPAGHKKPVRGTTQHEEVRVVMQPCKILCGKLEINFSVFPLPFTLLPEAHYSAAASPLLRPLLTPKSFTFKEQLSAFKDLSGQLSEAEEELPQVPPNPSRFTCPAEKNPTETASPPAPQTSRVNCSAQEVMQNSPTRSSFFFPS